MKKIVFLTGTRADFGKIKPILSLVNQEKEYELLIFVTGMHMLSKYGSTCEEVFSCYNRDQVHTYINQNYSDSMDAVLAKTISGFSDYVKEIEPDMIIVHGDRVEALAGAVVGSLNNILVAHIEGGEVSGTVDELIRHAISKLSHIHFVANESAHNRLRQLGEDGRSIYTIGSPDLDVMASGELPSIKEVREHYGITFNSYAIVMFHPVTTEVDHIKRYAENLVEALIQSGGSYVIIYPNNDLGSSSILESYEKLRHNDKFAFFPSMRFEYFLTLMKYSNFMIGNSSAGVREAPFYGLASINIGTRQNNRNSAQSIFNCGYEVENIISVLKQVTKNDRWKSDTTFGDGTSSKKFIEAMNGTDIWSISTQKYFIDLRIEEAHEINC